ncbi:MAG: STAS-like domain-containing protein [Nitrospirae bacterium]|nr:STAS-like domain-containing protein [Nitrospirota bacterium]
MNFKIKELIGPRCIIKEDGQKIYEMIHGPLLQGEVVSLDFSDVNQFASPFFNFAFGQLLKNITKEELERLLHFVNLNDTGKNVFERVIENAVKYYADKDYRKIVDDILEQQAKESD